MRVWELKFTESLEANFSAIFLPILAEEILIGLINKNHIINRGHKVHCIREFG